MNTTVNTPIYRAKKHYYDTYVEGYYIDEYLNPSGEIGNIMNIYGDRTLIDKDTLAIHFPDMLDSQGNKIFASLSQDGKGGDNLRIQQLDADEPFEDRTVLYDESSIHVKNIDLGHYCHLDMISLELAKVIGMRE